MKLSNRLLWLLIALFAIYDAVTLYLVYYKWGRR